MTVKELIEILKTLDQNEKIYIFGNPDSDGYMSIVDIESVEKLDNKIVIHDC